MAGRRKSANPHKDEAGYESSRANEMSGGFCVLYNAQQAGFDASGGRWAVFCSSHGVVVTHANKRVAISLLREPQRWCNMCKDLHEIQQAEHVLTLRHRRDDEDQLRLWANLARGNPEKSALFEDMYGMKPDAYWDVTKDDVT